MILGEHLHGPSAIEHLKYNRSGHCAYDKKKRIATTGRRGNCLFGATVVNKLKEQIEFS